MITGIDHVQVAAPPGCEPAARSLYGGLLELAEVDKPPALAARGGCWFAVGGQQLHVGVAQPFTPSAKAHPAFEPHSRSPWSPRSSARAPRSGNHGRFTCPVFKEAMVQRGQFRCQFATDGFQLSAKCDEGND